MFLLTANDSAQIISANDDYDAAAAAATAAAPDAAPCPCH